MRSMTVARSRISFVGLLAAGALLSGCANDATAPIAPNVLSSQSATSAFEPTQTSRNLVGVSDGTYTFTVDPKRDQGLLLGANLLYIPANAICDLASTPYGTSHWNEACTSQTAPLQITAVVRNAASMHPSIDFFPALRFSPDKIVSIYFYLQGGIRNRMASTWSVDYCNDAHVCVDESLTDPDLKTYLDWNKKIAFRRIKHFSGYIVVFSTDDASLTVAQ